MFNSGYQFLYIINEYNLNMGNAEICQQCENLEAVQQTKNTHRKRIRSRTIFQNDSKIYDQGSTIPKNIVRIDQGFYQAIYPDGGIYHGEMLGQLRHGNGKHMWLGGHYYEGEWRHDKGEGKGTLKTLDFLFEGQMLENRPVKGIMTALNKKKQEVYEGELKDFMHHGIGTLTVKNEYVYKGSFQNNKKHGNGMLLFANGSEYEGDFNKGAMSGNGRFKTGDLEYIGEFHNGKIHGQGKCIWKNGAIYVGNYINGIKEGYGEYTYEDGRTYKGLWKKGKPFELCYTFGKDKQQHLY